MYDDLEDPESEGAESEVGLIRTSTPSGLAGKRGGKGASYYSKEDDLLEKAVGSSGYSGRSYF